MARPTNHEKRYRNVGRPSKLTPEVIGKLEEIAALDGTIAEMCFYANINPDTYNEWMKQNPDLSDRLKALRNEPVLAARREVIKGIVGDKNFSMAYLGRRDPNMRPASKVEHEGTIKTQDVTENEEVKKLREEFDEKLRATIVASRKQRPISPI